MAQVYNRIFDEEKYKKVNQDNKNIIDDYIMELKSQKKAAGTISLYKNDLRICAIYCLDECENRSFLQMSKRDWRNFVLHAVEEWSMSNARVNRIMSSVRTILDFAENDTEEYEDYDRNTASKIKGLSKDPVRDVVFLPDDIIEKLYNKFINEQRYKEATLLALLYDSGARKNEIAQVERYSITLDGFATNTVIGKRSKKFKCMYFSRTKEAFKLYEENRKDDNTALFITSTGASADSGDIYMWVKSWKKDLFAVSGVHDYDDVNVHSFRHSYVENMLRGTHYLCRDYNLGKVPLEKVKTLVHHESSDTTLSYANNDEDRDIEELFGIKL